MSDVVVRDRVVPASPVPQQQQPTGLVPVAVAGPVAAYDPFEATARIWTNLDLSSQEGRTRFVMAKIAEAGKANDFIGQELEVVGVLIHPAETVDRKTGEAVQFTRTVLCLAPDGYIAFGSQGIIDSLATVMMLYGRGPWPAPIKLKLVQQGLGGNRRTFKLVPVLPAPAAPVKLAPKK